MADVISLRRVRKNKMRAEEAKSADENRLKFGQSKAQKQLLKAEMERAEKALTLHKRED